MKSRIFAPSLLLNFKGRPALIYPRRQRCRPACVAHADRTAAGLEPAAGMRLGQQRRLVLKAAQNARCSARRAILIYPSPHRAGARLL
eukprot:5040054-Pleurochrysis_carterae.AAC.2